MQTLCCRTLLVIEDDLFDSDCIFVLTDAELIGMICLSDAVNDAYTFILRKNLQSLVAVPETSRAAA